jgi:hypothetical protein
MTDISKNMHTSTDAPVADSTSQQDFDDAISTRACALFPLCDLHPTNKEAPVEPIATPNKHIKHVELPRYLLVFPQPSAIMAEHQPKNRQQRKTSKYHQTELPGFLRLPVELRNQIYECLIHQKLIPIKRNDDLPYNKNSPLVDAIAQYRKTHRPKAIKTVKILAAPHRKAKAKGIVYDRIPGQKPLPRKDINWDGSVSNLLLTCKTTYAEASPILYGSTVFYFDDARRLRAFLKTVSTINLSCITRLHVHVRTYGIPTNPADNVWQQKHIQGWTSLFAEIANKMTNLRALRISVSMRSLMDVLKRAFRRLKYQGDWKERAGYMVMLQPLSSLKKLGEFSVSIKATDHEMQLSPEIMPRLIHHYWILADVHPVRTLLGRVIKIHQDMFARMHRGLGQGMLDVARSRDVDESFGSMALAVQEYGIFMADPVTYMLDRYDDEA